MTDEERALKAWLVELLPEGWSRKDVADELRVERKTISSMLNPESSSFGQGRTLIRYLNLVGGLQRSPVGSPATSRLSAIEGKADGIARTLDDLASYVREHIPPEANQGHVTEG